MWVTRLVIGSEALGSYRECASLELGLLRREMLETYPLFLERISCPAVILGETGDSWYNPALDGKAIAGVI
jgi:hypothetical protein